MHQQENKSSLKTTHSQGDSSPPKINTFISTSSSNSNDFKRIFSPDITVQTNLVDFEKPTASLLTLEPFSDQNNSLVCDKQRQDQFEKIISRNRWSLNPPFKKTNPNLSLKQEKSQSLPHPNELYFNCLLTLDGIMIDAACQIRRGFIEFDKLGLSLQVGKITKMKIKYQQFQKCLELTYNDIKNNRLSESKLKIQITNDIKDDLYLLFSKIMIYKLVSLSFKINQDQKDDDKIDRFMMTGSILKKSKFIGKWQFRKMVITDRIQSFKCEKCTFQIKNIKEVWTRFDVIQNCLIVKVRHSFDKTELGVPMTNYCARFCKDNWIYRIYKLVSPSLT